jgi:HSP20 family protein
MGKAKDIDVKHSEPDRQDDARTSRLSLLRNEIDRLFDDLSWPDFGLSAGRNRAMAVPPALRSVMRAGAPAMDLVERPSEYEAQVELPGMAPGDIEIRMTDGTLVIKGEKTAEREEKEENYHLSERTYGAFQRAFRLPPGIDPDKVEAHFDNGVLKVHLPKTPETRDSERKIEVKAG